MTIYTYDHIQSQYIHIQSIYSDEILKSIDITATAIGVPYSRMTKV